MRRATLCLVLAGFLCLPAVAAAAGPPAISNSAPSNVRNHEATIHFSIDPEGLETTYYAEYGTTTAYGDRSWLYEWDLPAGDEPVALSEPLSVWGLAAGTTYHYRIVAYNEAGTTYGADQEVTTTNEPKPVVVTGSASEDTGSSVVLHGTVDPEGLPVTVCRFHYVTQSQFDRFGFTYSFGPSPTLMGILVPCEETAAEIGAGEEPVPVHAVVESYSPGRRHFRLEAENAYDAAVPGAAGAFGASSPQIEYLDPAVRNRTATLHFAIDPEGLETKYEVEYGWEEGEYYPLHYLWDGTLPAGEGFVLREAKLPAYFEGGLLPGTEYHYRVVAHNAAGTVEGPDEVFTTTDEPAPAFVNGAVQSVGPGAVEFTGTVNPQGNELTGCRFRWVTDSIFHNAGFEKWAATEMVRFGETVPCEETPEEIGSGSEPVPVHAVVSGLEPWEFFMRLEGENPYADAAAVGGVPFQVTSSGEVGKGCEQDPGCGPPQTKPPVVTPPQGPPAAPGAHPKKKKKKAQKKKRPHRAHHNSRISAR